MPYLMRLHKAEHRFLALITGKENTYFERCFQELPRCTEADRSKIPNAACTRGFDQLMRDAAKSGSLGEMLSVLIVCEWSYLSWSKIVDKDWVVVKGFNLSYHSKENPIIYYRSLLW